MNQNTQLRPRPDFFHIISRDYLAQNFFVMIFAGWVIYGIDALFEGHFTTALAIFAAILTPIGLLTFFWRYNLIVSTFVNGAELTGHVSEINTIIRGKRNRDYIIHYQYEFKGQAHQYRNRLKKNSRVEKLRQGQQVNLVAHPKTPHIAFIKEIYLEQL
ncbi:MAG: hypothetical protein IPO22_24120 [Anaerolineales bacterium]|jgi:hypothetical protein|nr:hypothetical protein [Anaerolineales bacterium]